MVKHYLCVVCNKKAKPRDRRSVPVNVKKFLNRNFSISCSENSVVCASCRYKFYKALKKPAESAPARVNERGDAGSSYAPPSTTERFTSPPSVSISVLNHKIYMYLFSIIYIYITIIITTSLNAFILNVL